MFFNVFHLQNDLDYPRFPSHYLITNTGLVDNDQNVRFITNFIGVLIETN